MNNLILSCDHAFLIDHLRHIPKKRSNRPVIGFTIRNWLDATRQRVVVQAYIQALSAFVRQTNALVQPIVQVNAPMYGDHDASITNSISKKLRQRGIHVLPTKTIRNVRDGVTKYAALDILLGMRMHSNILAATQGVPFVAVSYEHKTVGIAKQLGMHDYCIPYESIDGKKLCQKLMSVYKRRAILNTRLLKTTERMKVREYQRWKTVLTA